MFFCPCCLATLICEILVGVTCFCITCACTFHIYSTWTDRNEKSHFISSFYFYYQDIFTWLFRMERILHFSFSTCMSLTDFTYTAWIWLLFFVFILCDGYCLVLHVSVSLVSALSTYFSTWSDRNEKSHFHSSFYVYYQSVFIWHFRTNISCVRHHCQTHSMNLADFPCLSFFFFFSFFLWRLEFVDMWGIIWCCMTLYGLRLNCSYILSLNW